VTAPGPYCPENYAYSSRNAVRDERSLGAVALSAEDKALVEREVREVRCIV